MVITVVKITLRGYTMHQ